MPLIGVRCRKYSRFPGVGSSRLFSVTVAKSTASYPAVSRISYSATQAFSFPKIYVNRLTNSLSYSCHNHHYASESQGHLSTTLIAGSPGHLPEGFSPPADRASQGLELELVDIVFSETEWRSEQDLISW
jgi:hypothetical protein